MHKEKALLLYDGECPICKRFALYLRVREHIDMELRPLQETPELGKEFLLQGYDINDGMILQMRGQVFQGEAALLALEEYIATKTADDHTESLHLKRGWRLMRISRLRKLTYVYAKAIRVLSYRLRGKSPHLHP